MTVYVDDLNTFPSGQWCHLWADDRDELLAFAPRIGLKSSWLQHSEGAFVPDFWHFDLRPSKRDAALRAGATYKPLRDWVRMWRKLEDEQPGP